LSVGRFPLFEHSPSKGKRKSKIEEADFRRKKLPPPTPDRREGRLFPPEQSWKTSRLLNELPADRNKFYVKKFARSTEQQNDE
jgi:hypothetical protein